MGGAGRCGATAGQSFVASQKGERWELAPDRYDDGGSSGATAERPALQRLMTDVERTTRSVHPSRADENAPADAVTRLTHEFKSRALGVAVLDRGFELEGRVRPPTCCVLR